MTQRSYALFIVIIAIVLIFAPFFLAPVSAQGLFPGDEGPPGIVPCGDVVDGKIVPCQFCDLVKLADDSLDFAVYFTVFIATLLFAYAGFLYVTAAGDTTKISTATGIFGKVVVGMVIVLTAWLVVDIIMTSLLSPEYKKFGPWNEINCVSKPAGTTSSAKEVKSETSITAVTRSITNEDTRTPEQKAVAEQAVRDRLLAGGVSVAKVSCDVNETYQDHSGGCTDVSKLQEDTLLHILFFKERCNCDVVITAGSELGHADGDLSHSNGYKLDIAHSSDLDEYLQGNQRNGIIKIADRGDDPQYQDYCGNRYVNEGNHWDVLVQNLCTSLP